jgi:hypothetical protein
VTAAACAPVASAAGAVAGRGTAGCSAAAGAAFWISAGTGVTGTGIAGGLASCTGAPASCRAAPSCAPHCEQNFFPSAIFAPHRPQNMHNPQWYKAHYRKLYIFLKRIAEFFKIILYFFTRFTDNSKLVASPDYIRTV